MDGGRLYFGGGAGNRTPDTTDMSLPLNPSCFIDKSQFNNLINTLLRREKVRFCDLLRLFLLVLPREWHGEDSWNHTHPRTGAEPSLGCVWCLFCKFYWFRGFYGITE